MYRLIQKDTSGSWQVKGLPWAQLQAGETITEEARQILYGCLCKLKDYENNGMSPDQLKNWRNKLCDVATHVCDKLCRHPREITEQEKLDRVCESCPISVWVERVSKELEPERDDNMARFDYMEFGYCTGDFAQLVFHAKKYTKEQAVEIFNAEYSHEGLRCTIENVQRGFVKYFIRPNQFMSQDYDGGCYGFVDKPERGAFPVWVITLADLDFMEGGTE